MQIHPECVYVIIAATALLYNIAVQKRIPLPRQGEVVLEADENPTAAPVIPEDIFGRLVRNHIINNLLPEA